MSTRTVARFFLASISPFILTFTFISPAAAETYGACVDNKSGTITLVDSELQCRNRDYFITWNEQGDTGPQGPIGASGPAGQQGPQGEQGIQGVAGVPGAKGEPGDQGAVGLTGDTGDTGPAGAAGPTGADGTNGADGAQGPIGLTGSAGADGIDGADGQDGLACWDLNANGAPDLPGEDINSDGSVDVLDCAGAQGVAGIDGQDGANGVDGAPGAQGLPGLPGATGAQGPIGLIGPAGADGTNGADGAQGPIGLTGAPGADAPDRSLDICILYSALPSLPAPDYCPGPATYAIGDTGPGGGVVFHVTNGGLNGLEAASADQATATWCSDFIDIPGVDNVSNSGTPEDSNSGAVNTPLIEAVCGASSAAGFAAAYGWPNGQSDGFLPNIQELYLLYIARSVVGGFASTNYWSSSESFYGGAWVQSFATGTGQGSNLKNLTHRVRAVRAF